MKKVAVIGAGVSGLTTAFYIEKLSGGYITVKVLEKEKQCGGKMRTVHENGFIIETGPNGFLDNKPYTLELVKELGIEDRLYRSSDKARKRFVFVNGKLVRLPESPIAFLASYVLSFKGKLRLAAEYFVPPKEDDSDESLSSFVKRRIGEESLEKLIDPMAAGIFAGDPDRLSVKAAFPAVWHLEKKYGGLIKGLLAMKKEKKDATAGPGGVLMSFKNGVIDLIDALVENIKGEILTNTTVKKLIKEKDKWKIVYERGDEIFEETFDIIVLATPSYVAASLTKNFDKELSEKLNEIDYSPIAVVAFGFRKKGLGHDLDGFGFLVPRTENRKILGVLWDSSIFPNRAPEGKALIRAMVGGARQPQLAMAGEEEIAKFTYKDIKKIMKIRHKPEITKVFKHTKGIPHYTVGHLEKVEEIFKRTTNHKGLYLNSNAYKGVGVNDCVYNSLKTAEAVVKNI
ncbi:protoporphyrinogen oxidase [Desulfurobacterium atlanticum]|uniref:Coproporphyrinogen III oxidase n=1 Tax=Desulfurobacterium atlanticum TaxID=240169 RepID=A0A238XL75_9BACT|nr:protoporphyrinogen oxidase [Desulfurobacterium atlanticum]SNR59432.1 oxygen-dependent protoporphyrinogen oxidase [Desulfurobacterium atlanticum]